MNMMSNMYYDNIEEAAAFNTVLRRFDISEAKPLDEVEAMMYQWMIKKLTKWRDDLTQQAFKGLKDDPSPRG